MEGLWVRAILLILANSVISGVDSAATFTFSNNCGFTVWPGILSSAGIPPLSTTGFVLQSGASQTIEAPTAWGGRFWGRTYCAQGSNGKFSCLTGDCGTGEVQCSGSGAATPVTLAEFKLDGANGMDFYDISLVDGYNLPILVVPQGGSGVNCSYAGCLSDLNAACPSQLSVAGDGDGNSTVACRSACDAFGTPEYCCSGAYGSPSTCQASEYSRIFKSACPQAYSYAYDDRTSTFTCTGADYTLTFCPSPNTSQKSSSSGGPQPVVAPEKTDESPATGSMFYEGATVSSTAGAARISYWIVAVMTAAWRLWNLF
ncbi:hypothetical protein M569_03683 [Genlisea aurea]|uniref:Thaumatin-like protein 1 n=1 Tax=Genlisea aurea TaxID=192259 RepID=S8D166_9LAMI|nr:hypothetical protein M569_03683 [Genlisea aurea]